MLGAFQASTSSGSLSMTVGSPSADDLRIFASGVAIVVALENTSRYGADISIWSLQHGVTLTLLDLSGKLPRSSVTAYQTVNQSDFLTLEHGQVHRMPINLARAFDLSRAKPGSYKMRAAYDGSVGNGEAKRRGFSESGFSRRVESQPFDLIIEKDRTVWIKFNVGKLRT